MATQDTTLDYQSLAVTPDKFWVPRGGLTQKVKDKIEKAAVVGAQMLAGDWDWGERTVPRHNDGTLRAPIIDVMIAAGWSAKSSNSRKYLKTELFYTRLAYHRQRMEGGYKAELAKLTDNGDALKRLSEAAFESLLADLQDPDRSQRIPFKDRAKLYTDALNIEAKIKGDVKTRPGIGPAPSVVQNVLNVMESNMDPARFERMKDRFDAAHRKALDDVEGVIVVSEG